MNVPIRGDASALGRSAAVYGIRGVASLALLTVHVALFTLFGTRLLGPDRPPTNFWGAFFVSGLPSFIGVFFVLPAMYLYLPLARAIIAGTPRPANQGRGFLRRLLRLLPAYYAMSLIVLITLNRDEIDGVWYVLRPILLLQVYLPTPFTPKLMNGLEITWTVPTMVQWYAVLPLIAWAVHRYAYHGATAVARARRLLLPVPVLVATGIAWVFVVKGNGWDNRVVFWWPQGFAPAIGIGMALAILLALSQLAPESTPRLLRLGAARPGLFWLAAGVLYLINCARPFSVIGMDSIYTTSGLLVTYLVVAAFGLCAVTPLIAPGGSGGPRPVTAVLRSRPLVYVGTVSYGIYLWHFAVMHFYLQPDAIVNGGARPLREFYGVAGFWELELVTVVGAVLIATLSYHLVELPAIALGERFLGEYDSRRRRRRTAQAAAAEPAPIAAPTGTWTAAEATAAVTAAAADRDAIRANLLELEACRGAQLLSATGLTGATAVRWRSARADLATLWEVFTAWSAVLDHAGRTIGERPRPSLAELATVNGLLTGRSVVLQGTPTPLGIRGITDTGVTRLTTAEAVERMDRLFRRTAKVVSAVDAVTDQVSAVLDGIELDLHTTPASARVEAARDELHRLRRTLATDPLVFWTDGQLDASRPQRLRREVDAGIGGRSPEERLAC